MRAARSRSPSEQTTTDPSALTIRIAVTCDERFRNRAPVPWVPVASEPASDCASTSPRFSIASPCAASAAPSSRSCMPPWTSTTPSSTERIRSIRRSESIAPSVQAMSVNEWPDPATRTSWPAAAARPTASTSSSSDEGSPKLAGAQRCSPAQLRQTTWPG